MTGEVSNDGKHQKALHAAKTQFLTERGINENACPESKASNCQI